MTSRPFPLSLTLLTGVLFASTIFLFTRSTQAQGFPAHTVDLSARVGSSNLDGLDSKDHVTFGFSGGYNLSHFVAVAFDYDDLPQGSNYNGYGFSSSVYTVSQSQHLQLFGSSIRVGLGRGHLAVPYLVLGGGGILLTSNLKAAQSTGTTQQTFNATVEQHGSYLGGGAGVNIALGHHFGLRPEIRYEAEALNPVTFDGDEVYAGEKNIARGTIALYYHFGIR